MSAKPRSNGGSFDYDFATQKASLEYTNLIKVAINKTKERILKTGFVDGQDKFLSFFLSARYCFAFRFDKLTNETNIEFIKVDTISKNIPELLANAENKKLDYNFILEKTSESFVQFILEIIDYSFLGAHKGVIYLHDKKIKRFSVFVLTELYCLEFGYNENLSHLVEIMHLKTISMFDKWIKDTN